jgi:hypothetical protein
MYFPSTTTIDQGGAKSCSDFDGYHSAMIMGSQTVYYAVISECPAPQSPPITNLQNTTLTAKAVFHRVDRLFLSANGCVNGGPCGPTRWICVSV